MSRRRTEATDPLYRAAITRTFAPDPNATDERGREGWSTSYYFGPYSKPGPARAAITQARKGDQWHTGMTTTGHVEECYPRWVALPHEGRGPVRA